MRDAATKEARDARLPIRRSLTLAYILSLIVAVLVAAASVAGLAYRAIIYPTDEMLRAFVPNDVVNLFVGLPLLLASIWMARRCRLLGLLCWPGALLFVLYVYLGYVFALPLTAAFVLHLALVVLSAYALLALFGSMDAPAVQASLRGAVPERAAGGVLAGLGLLFFLRATAVLLGAVLTGTVIPDTDLAVNVSDFLVAPAWVVGGVLLWQRNGLGYAMGLGLLLGLSMLFIALIAFLLLQPLLTAAPFAPVDVAVVFAMGMVCFIPLFLFARGVVSRRNRASAQMPDSLMRRGN